MKKKNNFTILFQGDSITDCGRARDAAVPNTGLGSGYALFAAGRMLHDMPGKNLQFWNKGISGNRVVDLYARWKIDALNLKPDLISILIGVNDTWHEFASENGVEVERYGEIYSMLLSWTVEKLPRTKIILMEPFVLQCGAVGKDWPAEIDQRRKIVKKLAAEFNATFLPLQALFNAAATKNSPEYWLRDGVHPSCAGHMLIADTWVKTALKLI